MDTLHQIAPGVHTADTTQSFYGLEVGTRMTVLELDAGLLIHSPIALDAKTQALIEGLGKPRWVLAPNLFHHLYVGPWLEAGLEGWAAPGLAQKRPDLSFHGVITPESAPFGDELKVFNLTCFPFSNEVIVYHRPSRTLIVTDLVFNFSPHMPWTTRAVMRCMCGYPGCQTTLVERIGMRRAAARHDLSQLLSWDFDRVIMAHGDVIETGGRAALLNAFRWLGLGPALLR